MAKTIKKRRRLVFMLEAPHAREVILMADFNKWDRKVHLMKQDKNRVWKKTVVIPPGRHEYKFLVDGQWWHDPRNRDICFNKHGTFNSVINVP